MIRLTRLNRVPLVLNSDLIEHIEVTPDTVIALTNGLVVFGGGKDPQFYDDIAALAGDTRTPGSRRSDFDFMPIVQRGDLRRIPPGRALLLSEHTRPIRLRLQRCITGRAGRQLLHQAAATARQVETARSLLGDPTDASLTAVAWSQANGLATRGADR